MRTPLAFVACLLASTALAQQRQPANLSTLPTTVPQQFDLLDNSGAWVPLGSVSNGTFKDWLDTNIDPRTYGAKCDGVQSGSTWAGTDDTAALRAWAAATVDNARMFVPGVCLFSGQIAFPPTAYGVSLIGLGHPGTLVYVGANTTLDPLIQIGQRTPDGSTNCYAKGWAIKGLRIMSSTVMTVGDGLRMSDICDTQVDDLTIGGNLDNGNNKLFNALHVDGGNTLMMRGFILLAHNDALRVNGEAGAPGVGSKNFVDPMFVQGQLVGSGVGLHICGAVGGLTIDQSDDLLNGQNVLIDQSCVARPNTQMMFGPHFMSDVTSGGAGIGVHVSDPGIVTTNIIYRGWLASATNQCFLIDNMAAPSDGKTPEVDFIGAKIGNCQLPNGAGNGAAIENNNQYYSVTISGGNFFLNNLSNPNVYNSPSSLPMTINGISTSSGFSITGAWVGAYKTKSGNYLINSSTDVVDSVSTSATRTLLLSAPNNAGGAIFQMTGNGATTPNKFIRTHNGNLEVISSDYSTPLFTLSDTGGLLLAANTGTLRTGLLTVATLPTCNVSTNVGLQTTVTNAQASPPYFGAVGTLGAVVAPVFCAGAAGWVYH